MVRNAWLSVCFSLVMVCSLGCGADDGTGGATGEETGAEETGAEETGAEETGEPECTSNSDCSDGDGCTIDTCTLEGICAYGYLDDCCTTAEDCAPSEVACVVVECVAHFCVDNLSNCSGGNVTVETLAGTGEQGWVDGPAETAMFFDPFGIAVGSDGTVYVTDLMGMTVRAISGGIVSTHAGGANTVPGKSGVLHLPPTFAGFQDGMAEEALFDMPVSLAAGAEGQLVVADMGNHAIREVLDGWVTTIAGQAAKTSTPPSLGGGFLNGLAEEAYFAWPSGVLIQEDGGLLVSDTMNHCIRRIADGGVTTWAGVCEETGFLDGPSETALMAQPGQLAWGPDGSVYVADTGNHAIRRIADGVVSTLVGSDVDNCPAGTDLISGCHADGPIATASLSLPVGVAVDPDGGVYISEQAGNRISRVVAGTLWTVAGTGEAGHVDGEGAQAQFNLPAQIALGSDGVLRVVDRLNQRIRTVTLF